MAVIYEFDELLIDHNVIYGSDGTPPVSGGPAFANTVIRHPGTGARKINITRPEALETLIVDMGLLSPAATAYILNWQRGGYGVAVGFRMMVPWDFYAVEEVFGTGDGTRTVWNLIKTYIRPGGSRAIVRRIIKPVVNAHLAVGSASLTEPNGSTPRVIPSAKAAEQGVPAFTVKKNNVATTAYTIDNTTGEITFTVAPANGVVLSWSGEFDCAMAFAEDMLKLTPYDVTSEAKGVGFEEIHYSELGIT